jgi:hypothetical protein
MPQGSIFVGIDVAKAHLDIALRPTAEGWRVANDDPGITPLVARLRDLQPVLIVLEATGGLEVPVTAALSAAGLPVVVVNPRQARDFAKATGRLAKTDALDAHGLAHFAEAVRPAQRPLPDAQTQALSAQLARRRQLLDMLTAEKNRLGSAPRTMQAEFQAHITWLERRLTELNDDLGLVNLIDYAGMAYTLAVCKLPDGYLRGNRTPLYRCGTAWHPRPMKAAPRVRSALFSSNGIVIWSCHEHLDVNQPVHTPSVSGRDHQPWSVALLPLLSELP